MTYRRLSRHILTGGVLAFLILWLVSLGWIMSFYSFTRPFTFSGNIGQSNLVLVLDLMEDPACAAYAETDFYRIPPDHREFTMGSFMLDATPRKHAPSRNYPIIHTGPDPDFEPKEALNYQYRVHLPLWFPWLLLMGTALTACHIMQKRSRASPEKKLAERVAADSLRGDPG